MTPSPLSPGRPHFAEARGLDGSRAWRRDDPLGDRLPMLSVVVPAKNEAESLPKLVEEIAQALRPLCGEGEDRRFRLGGFEILIVNDGSTDRTPEVLEELSGLYPELREIRLRTNVGQSGATAAGVRAARGGWIATLDADLQNDPADLALLWRLLPGHDVALGWREKRQDAWFRRVVSRCANRVRNAVLGQSIRDTGCSVRIFPRELALRLPLFQGSHRFLGPLLIREGARVAQTPVNHRARPHGRSHYNFRNRSFRVVVDLVGVSWLMRRPLRYEVVDPAGDDAGVVGGIGIGSERDRGALAEPGRLDRVGA